MGPLSFYTGIIKDFGIIRTARLARAAFRAIGKHDSNKISAGFIELSRYCSRDCGGCYAIDGKGDLSVMDVSVSNNFVRELHELGAHEFAFTGGEPLESITKDVVLQMIEDNPRDVFYICTNGGGVDDKTAERLSAYNNVIMALSIDGFKETNDARRGEGAYDAVVNASKLLRKNKVPLGAYVTVMSQNYKEVSSKKFMDFLTSLGFKYAHGVRFFPHKGKLSITDEQYVEFLYGLYSIAQEGKIILTTPNFGNMANSSLKQRNNPITLDRDGGIKVGREEEPSGNIYHKQLVEIVSSEKFQTDLKNARSSHGRDGDLEAILEQLNIRIASY